MKYEKAKQLRNAGFLQMGAFEFDGLFSVDATGSGKWLWPDEHYPTTSAQSDGVSIGKWIDEWIAYAPTIDELIEACGGRNIRITIEANGYCEAYHFATAAKGDGLTLDEALANLWLAHDHRKRAGV